MEADRIGRLRHTGSAVRIGLGLAVCLGMAAVCVASGPPAGEGAPGGDLRLGGEAEADPVAGELVTDAAAVAPGRAFRVGVLLKMRPDWHVYWKHPGDAGLATEVTFDLPAGFTVSPLQWPVPSKFASEGEITSYGYASEVLLWAQVRSPRALKPGGKIRIGAKVSWLACRQLCLPGEGTYSIELPTAAAAVADTAGADVFGRWRPQLPMRVADSDAVAAAEVSGSIDDAGNAGAFQVAIDWKTPPRDVQWFPASPGGVQIKLVKVETADGKTRIAFTAQRLAGVELVEPVMETVLAWRGRGTDGGWRAAVIPVRLLAADTKSTDTKE